MVSGTEAPIPLELPDLEEPVRKGLKRARALGRRIVVSRTRALADPPDPLALFSAAEQRDERRFFASCPEERFTLLGVGLAHEIVVEAPDRFAVLRVEAERLFRGADLEPRQQGGLDGPLLVGGSAFAPRPPSAREGLWRSFGDTRFTLPELLLVWRAGGCEITWSLRVDPIDDEKELVRRLLTRLAGLFVPPSRRPEARAQLVARPQRVSREQYRKSAAELIAAIRRREAEKVVLARVEREGLSGELRAGALLRHLQRAHPSCLVFALGIGHDTFLGATPEQLVRRVGDEVIASAVAGTVPVGAPRGSLERSPKERSEHAIVVDAIEENLREFCGHVEVPQTPSLLTTGTVQHLRTVLWGRLARPTHVLDVAARLHPTPAVCGTPRERALELIDEHEPFDRGWYAGLQGWFDAAGQGEFFVALRSGLIRRNEVNLYAGAGLVEDSDPDREAAETLLKLSSLREALELTCAT